MLAGCTEPAEEYQYTGSSASLVALRADELTGVRERVARLGTAEEKVQALDEAASDILRARLAEAGSSFEAELERARRDLMEDPAYFNSDFGEAGIDRVARALASQRVEARFPGLHAEVFKELDSESRQQLVDSIEPAAVPARHRGYRSPAQRAARDREQLLHALDIAGVRGEARAAAIASATHLRNAAEGEDEPRAALSNRGTFERVSPPTHAPVTCEIGGAE
ncbi:MAG: hypothetical protein AAF411_08345 [Myxococcota bacterium]